MKIIIDRQIPFLSSFIRSNFPEAEIWENDSSSITSHSVQDTDALFIRTRTRIDKSLLEGSRVKFIGTATIGTDHIDLEWCERNGIKVVSAPGCNSPAVMQYVAASLFKAGFKPGTHNLGVVGKGHIGSLVTELYRKAGTNVLVCDPPREEAGMTDEEYLSLDELLRNCDAVTFHVPYTVAGKYPTHHLLNPNNLPSRPQIIVNASRGGVIDPQLVLTEGDKRKFIIDTWVFEDTREAYDMNIVKELTEKSFIATPHIAGYSREGKYRASVMMSDAFNEFYGINKDRESPQRLEPYRVPELEDVVLTFDPMTLSDELKAHPERFETMRALHLRREAPSDL